MSSREGRKGTTLQCIARYRQLGQLAVGPLHVLVHLRASASDDA
jgi:hypothetical protein